LMRLHGIACMVLKRMLRGQALETGIADFRSNLV
jgi:hypothetical protein